MLWVLMQDQTGKSRATFAVIITYILVDLFPSPTDHSRRRRRRMPFSSLMAGLRTFPVCLTRSPQRRCLAYHLDSPCKAGGAESVVLKRPNHFVSPLRRIELLFTLAVTL